MNDYTRVSRNKKDQIFRFCKTISKGLSVPNFKFICCMIFGILCAKSVLLSDIARVLNEPILLKKTIERLSNRLKIFQESDRFTLFHNYLQTIRPKFDNRSIFCIDLSDITKTYGTHFEHMGEVFDGSTGNRKAKGYSLLEIVGLSNRSNAPLPVYSKVLSNEKPDFVSEPEEILTALKHLTSFVGNRGIRTLDRGFDSLTYIRYFVSQKQSFLLRATKKRLVVHRGKTKNILSLARSYKGRYVMEFDNKAKKKQTVRVSCVKVELPKLPGVPLFLIICFGYGKEPMLLLSNQPLQTESVCTSLAKVYFKRWKIEEYFRFKKQQFQLENLRVRSFESICNINLMATLATAFLGLLAQKDAHDVSIAILFHYAKRTNSPYKFHYYRISDGLTNVFRLAITTILSCIKPTAFCPPYSQQLNLSCLASTG